MTTLKSSFSFVEAVLRFQGDWGNYMCIHMVCKQVMVQQNALKMESMADGSVHPEIARVTGWLVLKNYIFVFFF